MEEKELKEALASLAKKEGSKDALAQIFTEWIPVNHITTDFVGMLLNARSLNEGDVLTKKIRRLGSKVHTLVNYWTASL